MRTGNKLLLAFVALVVLLMLFSDIVLWANFKKGITGNERQPLHAEKKPQTIALQPVKVLVLTGDGSLGVAQSKGESYLVLDGYTSTNQFSYSQTNDTLSIQLFSGNGITLSCPDINTVLLSHSTLRIYNQKLSQLNIRMGDSCRAELMTMNIGMLSITGGIGSDVSLSDGASEIDSFKLQLGKYSSFGSYDIPYQYTNMKMDSIKSLMITGRSLNALKEIK